MTQEYLEKFISPACYFNCACLVAQLCPTLCNPMDCSLPGSFVHGDSPSKNTGVGCRALLQGIFSTQGSNLDLLHCRWILNHLNYQGSFLWRRGKEGLYYFASQSREHSRLAPQELCCLIETVERFLTKKQGPNYNFSSLAASLKDLI